jgi:hypothetical protein
MVVNAEVEETNEPTLRSAWRSTLKKDLTEPTLLEMSGNPFTGTVQHLLKSRILRLRVFASKVRACLRLVLS